MRKFLTNILDSINRFRESLAVKKLQADLEAEKLRSSDLAVELKLAQEQSKVDELAIRQLRTVIERDHERVKAESAIAVFNQARLGAVVNDSTRQGQ